MRKFLLPVVVSMGAALFVAVSVFGAGGGGGGSAPSCTEDIWQCSSWSECSLEGKQTRSCVLTFDCGLAETPKPDEEQVCTPPQPAEQASPTSAPAAPQAPACTEDIWECSKWSSCDTQGNQRRTCRLTFDCVGVETPEPRFTKRCETLQCGNKETLDERVFCRLNLAPSGIAREYEIQYLPEECRAINQTGLQKACVARYNAYQPCWEEPVGESRFACARTVLQLGPLVAKEVQTCKGKTAEAQVQCKKEVKEKVYGMINFRFYDLEERAEDLAERGADVGIVADFVTLIEMKKQEFNVAKTTAERRKIILDVRQGWKDFVDVIKDQVQ